jgi:hypothetical protein
MNYMRLINRRFFTTTYTRLKKELTNEPIKFSTSKAATHKAIDTFTSATIRSYPKSQPYIVFTCLLTFICYFTFIREQNDLDDILERPLEETLPELKKEYVKKKIEKLEKIGADTTELKELLNKKST